MDSTEMEEKSSTAEEKQEISLAVAVRSSGISTHGRSCEEITKTFHDGAASDPEIRRKYNKRKLAAVKYSKYAAFENGLMSKYPVDVLCK